MWGEEQTLGEIASVLVDTARLWLRDYTEEMIVYERYRALYESGELMSGALFWYVHAGLIQASDKLRDWDPHLERPVKAVLEESLAKAIQQRARERGVTTFADRHGNERRLDDLYENFSRHGEFGPTDDEKVAQALLENSSNLEGVCG